MSLEVDNDRTLDRVNGMKAKLLDRVSHARPRLMARLSMLTKFVNEATNT